MYPRNPNDILTVSFGNSINTYSILSKSETKDLREYFLFNRFKIFQRKIDIDKENQRKRKREHKKLSKQKIIIENFYNEDYLNNTNKYLLVTVSFNNANIIDYQIKLIKRYIKGSYTHIICDNSNKIESARKIKEICKNNNITYIRINSSQAPNGYSDSHGIALNWVWENILKEKEKDFALLDHDIFPIIEQKIENYFNKQDFWGPIRYKNKNNQKDVWSLWPGFAFYKFEPLKDKKLNFRRYKRFGFLKVKCIDTGSANWPILYSKYDTQDLNDCDIITWDLKLDKEFVKNQNKNSDFEECIEYVNNKTWIHSINGSEWHDSKGKISLVYEMLDKLVNRDLAKNE